MKSYSGNCTLPTTGEGFVSSPNLRGTLDIAWSCLSVPLICTWSVLHLNVPVQSKCKGKMHRLCRATYRTFIKLQWMLFNLLAPEWSLAKAWADSRSVAFVRDRFRSAAEADGVDWEGCHSHFANLGGFAISFAEVTTSAPCEAMSPPCDSVSREGCFSTTQSLSRDDFITGRNSIPGESIHMRDRSAEIDTRSNEGIDSLGLPFTHADSERMIDRIDSQSDERDQDQPKDSLVDQPRTIRQSTSHSTLQTSLVALEEPSNIIDTSQHGADDGMLLPPRLQQRLNARKKQKPLDPNSTVYRSLSRFVGPIQTHSMDAAYAELACR